MEHTSCCQIGTVQTGLKLYNSALLIPYCKGAGTEEEKKKKKGGGGGGGGAACNCDVQ